MNRTTTIITILVITLISPLMFNAELCAEVNLYSARKEALVKPALDKFTNATGIKVNLITGKADVLLKRLATEGANSPADLFLTTDAGRLHRAKALDVLQAVNDPDLLKVIPVNYRDHEGFWFGLSLRSRVILYVKGKVDPAQLSTYEDLASDKWRGRLCIRTSNNIYNQSLVASMIASIGRKPTLAWAEGLVKNFSRPPRGGDSEQILAAAAGVCDIALTNTYYFGRMLNSKDAKQRTAAAKMELFWPNQTDRGAHFNVSGIGLTKVSKHKQEAIKLMNFLASPDIQKWYAEANYEFPINSATEISSTLKSWGPYKADVLNLSYLGLLNPDAVMLMDRAHWR